MHIGGNQQVMQLVFSLDVRFISLRDAKETSMAPKLLLIADKVNTFKCGYIFSQEHATNLVYFISELLISK